MLLKNKKTKNNDLLKKKNILLKNNYNFSSYLSNSYNYFLA